MPVMPQKPPKMAKNQAPKPQNNKPPKGAFKFMPPKMGFWQVIIIIILLFLLISGVYSEFSSRSTPSTTIPLSILANDINDL